MQDKNKIVSGANELTPSKSEYFSWINSTNEGSTQLQTQKNLQFFRYLHDTFGMTLDIYAWDAGNLDGAGNSYESETSPKIRAQYPNGYEPIVKLASQMNTRMGVWGGPDGYGDTQEQARMRQDLLVHLCKDYNWALFKFDAVCGDLRENMRSQFAKTLTECRNYSPDLILLNHRINLGEVEKYATTFLWEGNETYTDVHAYNKKTAPHNRGYIFSRGHTPNLRRLTEDHGVCISSSIDFFEDDLVYQAFNRCLILAPEIYGNPWFMRDDELPVLARIFNLHRRYRDILVNGMVASVNLGDNAVVRGDSKRRFLCTGFESWQERYINIPLNNVIGLETCEKVAVVRRFPTEKVIGVFNYGEQVKVDIPPYRACLFEICNAKVCDDLIGNCEYEVLHETNGVIDEINVLSSEGDICVFSPYSGKIVKKYNCSMLNKSLKNPIKLGCLQDCEIPANDRFLYEKIHFSLSNDSLEKQSLIRSGNSDIVAVSDARDAFFNQYAYLLRGTDSSALFSGEKNRVYDVKSRSYINFDNRKGFRIEGGCLRVDLGDEYLASRVEIEFFSAGKDCGDNFEKQTVCDLAEYSLDLHNFKKASLIGVEKVCDCTLEHLAYYCDKTQYVNGERVRASFEIKDSVRYFLLPNQPDRLYSFKVYNGEKEVVLVNPKVNNLFAHYLKKKTLSASKGRVTLKNLPLHPYIAVAVEGNCGNENVCVIAFVNGKEYHFPNRAPHYVVNPFEYPVHPVDGYYTFYLPVKQEWINKEIEITALFACEKSVPCDIYLCDGHGKRIGEIIKL